MKLNKSTYLVLLLCAIGIILVFRLSWQADPNLKGLPLVPSWVYNWTDSYKNATVRTAVPFIAIALTIGAWCSVNGASALRFLIVWAVLTGVVVLAEFGQYFIPSRDFDIKDIFWGSAGSFLGLGLMFMFSRFIRLLRKQ